MTNITFSLGSVLEGKLANPGNGVNVYAYAFEKSTLAGGPAGSPPGSPAAPVQIITDGVYNATATLALSTIASGNIIIVTQETKDQNGDPLPGVTALPTASTTQLNDVFDVNKAQAGNYRYDAIELTLSGPGGSSDVADLTNIVQFGMPMSLTVNYSNAPQATRGYSGTGQDLIDNLVDASPANSQNQAYNLWAANSWPLNSSSTTVDQRETMMTDNNVVPNPLNVSSDWNAFVNGLASIEQEIRIAHFFGGVAADPAQNQPYVPASFSYYSVDFDGTYVVMKPIKEAQFDGIGNGFVSTPGIIKIPALSTSISGGYASGSALTENIYAQAGQMYVYMNEADAASNDVSKAKVVKAPNGQITPETFGTNDAYGSIVKYLLAGFEAGFWGGSALSIPDAELGTPDPTRIDLNQTWNWTSLYAYNAIGGPTGPLAAFDYQNSVGTGPGSVGGNRFYDPFAAQIFQYSNAYGWAYSDFLASLGGATNPAVSVYDTGLGNNVDSIEITLFDLSEPASGYQAYSFADDYLTPSGTTMEVSANQFLIDASVGILGGSGTVAPVAQTHFAFEFYSNNQWVSLALPLDPTYGYSQVYTITEPSPGDWQIVGNGYSGQAGAVTITGMPVTNDKSVGWYRLVLGSGSTAQTYNFYAQQGAGTGFENTASDGGSSINLSNSNEHLKLILSTGGAITYNPEYWLSADPTPVPPPPPPQILSAPLVGDNVDGIFMNLPDLSDLKQGDVAFSYNAVGTNTAVGGNIVKILLSDIDHSSWILTPISAPTTLSGDWLTAMSSQFGNGSYSAFMQQYKPANWALDRPVGAATVPVDFTVALEDLLLGVTSDGQGLQLASGGSGTLGNWIELSAISSTLLNGTLVAFATDSAGNMLTRDTNQITTSLDEAALGRIGSVASDGGGQVFFSGAQQIYLSAGEHLRFALVTGDGVVDISPTVNVTGSGGNLNVRVSDSAGTINIAAAVNNSLDSSAVLAGSQRTTDHSWVYLTQGTQVGVDLAWSGDYVNTLHFVRIDVNPADPSQMRVGGVAYGNTDAFRTALQNNWEFAATQGHSTGTSSTTWTVQGGDGFYAPVLVTQAGDIFTINASATNTANVDGRQHIRNFGENTFGFEDMNASAPGADFDFNDMVLHLWLVS